MNNINPQLANQYACLVKFLSQNPDLAAKSRSSETGSENYIIQQAKYFAQARLPKTPTPPGTVPDEVVSTILVSYFGINPVNIENIKIEHQLSMSAENMVGDLLERYLASIMEPHGWIWCSGSMVKAVDFIRPRDQQLTSWELLQVKNRDNSENSSSSAIRNNTPIIKWHRTFSRTGKTNWSNFPDHNATNNLSEEGFKSFVVNYLTRIKS